MFIRRHKINKLLKHQCIQQQLLILLKPDIVSLLFVDEGPSHKLETLESKYSADVAVTGISAAMVNNKSFD